MKYKEYEEGKIVEICNEYIPTCYYIDSIGVDNDRYYAILNKITIKGNVDKRCKTVKKYFDENNFNLINVLTKGDKVFLHERGAISWELEDYTDTLIKNHLYSVLDVIYDKTVVYAELRESGIRIHPNHFIKGN